MTRRGGHVLICPTGCGRRRAVGNPVCWACWQLVPVPVQIAAREAWQALARDARPQAFKAYAAAASRVVDTALAVRELSQPWPPSRRGRVVE